MYILESHQVGHALQGQVRYAAVVLVTAVPKGQLLQNEEVFKKALILFFQCLLG